MGWPLPPPFNAYNARYDYSARAPIGHLPSPRWFGRSYWQKHLQTLTLKLEECGIFAATADEEVNLITQPSKSKDLVFISARGTDYTNLFNLLKNQEWLAANQEPERVLLEASCQQQQGWLGNEDLKILSCQDLEIIDTLWVKYSQKRFGFSIQNHIWQELNNKNYQIFGARVGWCNNGSWLTYKQLDFSLHAKMGHLPVLHWWFGNAVWGLKGLFKKMDICNI